MNREADALPGVGIEIGMRGGEGLRFGGRRLAKTVDVMMAVALGVGDADEGAEREVLLHSETGLAGEVSPVTKNLSPSALHFAARVALTMDL